MSSTAGTTTATASERPAVADLPAASSTSPVGTPIYDALVAQRRDARDPRGAAKRGVPTPARGA
jgi:hypothetical protein